MSLSASQSTAAEQACYDFTQYIARELDADPYLSYRPTFGYSMPAQVFIQGITFTLLAVLLIHILFTTPYHWPLSRLNYILQVSGILLVMGSVLLSTGLTLTAPDVTAQKWPYMLEYISVTIPPDDWSIAAQAAYQLLQGFCNMAVNLAHIQFLTLLFPSSTEVKLIFFILGPVALAASGLSFTALSSSRTTIDLGDAVANVFDSTLILIFTISLLLWGCVVNRRRAWRFDGGTAIFGAGAIALAFISTAINFVLVKEDGLNWLQNLTWAVILWQSWLGFWWWTGSGMGIGEVEDILANEERHRIKAERNGRQTASKQRRADGSSRSGGGSGRAASLLSRSMMESIRSNGMLTRRRHTLEVINEVIEMDDLSPVDSSRNRHITISDEDPRAASGTRPGPTTPSSSVSTSSRTPTLNPPTTMSNALMYPFIVMQIYFRRLRQGHEAATKAKALDRVERRERAFRSIPESAKANKTARKSVATLDDKSGWGLGSFGIRQAEEARERIGQSRRILREGLLLHPEEETEEERNGADTPGGSRQKHETAASYPDAITPANQAADLSDAELGEGCGRDHDVDALEPLDEAAFAALEREVAEEDDNWVDEAVINIDAGPAQRKSPLNRRRWKGKPNVLPAPPEPEVHQPSDDNSSDTAEGTGSSWSWWGPFRKWRLVDRSNY